MNDIISKNNNPKPPKRDASLHAHHRQRMKDKFLKYGLEIFSEHEIMELLLFYVLPHVDTNEIAHHLINKGGSFSGAFQIPYDEMKKISGIKDQAATFLKLIPELARYYAMKEAEHAASPGMTYEEIARLCVSSYIGYKSEVLTAFYFDPSMHLVESKTIGIGSFHSVSTNISSIIDSSIKLNAPNCVLAHNHPTSSLFPSPDDFEGTNKLQRIFAQADINLVEHFVVSGDSYLGILKFKEEHS